MPPTVFLYDIDGTLVNCGGAGRRAMTAAFTEVVGGHAEAIEQVKFSGMTDGGIVRAALEGAGLSYQPQTVTDVLTAYLEKLGTELEGADPPVEALEGVEASLEAAARGRDTAIGLGTGNVVGGAELKLNAVGLWNRFAFGGYGSDSDDRATVIRIAAERGAALLGRSPAECTILVIGDTPKDVTAAHANGARCLGIATGSFSPFELRDAGADWVAGGLGDMIALRAVANPSV